MTRNAVQDYVELMTASGGRPGGPENFSAKRGRKRWIRSEGRLARGLILDGKRLPAGKCWIRQSPQAAELTWTDQDGAVTQREISLELLAQLLSHGVLQRQDDAR